MKLLVVGFGNSVHLARNVSLVSGLGWDVRVFPAIAPCVPEEELRNVVFYDSVLPHPAGAHPSMTFMSSPRGVRTPGQVSSLSRAAALAGVIREFQPDIIHSHELQHSAYLTFDAMRHLDDDFPTWIVSNWGADISHFGSDPAHAERIRLLLAACDYYWCECERDVALARRFGFGGEVLPVFPIAGGFDLDWALSRRHENPPSRRRTIAIKGYQGVFGRGLNGIQALELCADVLRGYRIGLYLAQAEVLPLAERVFNEHGIELTTYSRMPHEYGRVPHEQILDLHARSRVSISLSSADGISTSFLEALAMGSFPIQSNSGCAMEWSTNGEGALFVDPEDVDAVSAAIRRALTDDNLVDHAAEVNGRILRERLDQSSVRKQVTDVYLQIARESRRPGRRHWADQPGGSRNLASTETHSRPQTRIADGRTPLVTIITPTYNRAGLLDQTIQSVLSQEYPRIEYIVLDDGSTDDTESVVEPYRDRLTYRKHDNIGESRTVNRGFEMARGDIIGVVSSDDPLLPGAIDAAVHALSTDSDLIAVYPDWNIIDEDGEFIAHIATFDYSLVDMVRWHYCIPGPGTMFRRWVADRLGGRDVSYRYIADFEFWLRAGLLGPFRRIPEPLATWRQHGDSATVSSKGYEMALEYIRVSHEFLSRDNLPDEVLAVRDQAYRSAFHVAASCVVDTPAGNADRFVLHDKVAAMLMGTDDHALLARVSRLQKVSDDRREKIDRLQERLQKRDLLIERLKARIRADNSKREQLKARLQTEVGRRGQSLEGRLRAAARRVPPVARIARAVRRRSNGVAGS